MDMNENKRRRSMLLYILIAVVVYLAVSQTMYPALTNSQTKEVSYSDFLTMVDKNEVTQVQKTQGDAQLYFTTGSGDSQQKYSTVIFGSGDGLNEKLVRRHPHVFGDLAAASDGQAPAGYEQAHDGDRVLDIWDDVKRLEREVRGQLSDAEPGLLDSVPQSLPALMQAQKISKRAAKAGFEWADLAGVWDKVAEERAEFEAEEPGTAASQEEFGDLLFALVNVARWSGVDAEEALAASNRKFRRRWARMEELARAQGRAVEDLSTVEQNELWDRAKGEEKPAE